MTHRQKRAKPPVQRFSYDRALEAIGDADEATILQELQLARREISQLRSALQEARGTAIFAKPGSCDENLDIRA
jgi:hypothetical protein